MSLVGLVLLALVATVIGVQGDIGKSNFSKKDAFSGFFFEILFATCRGRGKTWFTTQIIESNNSCL